MSRNYFQHSTNFKTLNGLRGGTSEQRFDTSLLPSVSETYDLGSGTLKWQELYVNKVDALGGESRFTSVDVTDTMRTNDLVVTGTTTYSLLAANDADIAALKVTNVNARTVGGEILVGDDMRLGADEILYTNKIRSNPAGGTVTVYDNLTVLGTLNYTLPPAPSAVFGTLGDTEIGDLVTDPLDASPPEAADSNLQPAAERVLSAPTINATQWISTPFLTLMGLAQTDKLKVTSNLVPASATDFNNTAFWNEGGAILQGRTYIDECIPNTLSVVGDATVGGTFSVTSGPALLTTLSVAQFASFGPPTPFGSSGYNGVTNSFLSVRSTDALHSGTTDHAGTLLLMDNTNPEGSSGGKGGSVVFGGPYHDFGENFQGAAGRVRGITNNGAYGGSLTIETVDTGGLMNRHATITGQGNVGIGTTSPGRKFDVNGIARSTQMEVEASGTSLLVTPRKRQAADADGWVTLDPNGGDNSVDNTGVYVWGSVDVEGNFKSRKTGPATSVTVGPNTFAGGISVNDTSVMRNLTFTNAAGSFMNVAVGEKGGVPTAGWVSLDPNGGGANSGVFFYDLTEFSGRSTFLAGVTSSVTGSATSITSGPNIFAGGIACDGVSYFRELNVGAFSTGLTSSPLREVTGGNQTLDAANFYPNSIIYRIGNGLTDTMPTAANLKTQLDTLYGSDTYALYSFFELTINFGGSGGYTLNTNTGIQVANTGSGGTILSGISGTQRLLIRYINSAAPLFAVFAF